MDIKACTFSDAAQLTLKVAGAEATGLYVPFYKDPDDDISFHGFEEDPDELKATPFFDGFIKLLIIIGIS